MGRVYLTAEFSIFFSLVAETDPLLCVTGRMMSGVAAVLVLWLNGVV